jgi:2-(1,2-epoxy-1,2-dihydrophenyl)acetyl-CoA isomerase
LVPPPAKKTGRQPKPAGAGQTKQERDMTEQAVLSQDRGRVRILTLNRPARMNALDETMREDMKAHLESAKHDDNVAVVVITGAGRAFSAGADLQRFADIHAIGTHDARESFTSLDFPRALINFPKPMIAAINGVSVGWGFTMPLICDIRLASQAAVFSAGFVRVGVVPEFGSSHLLPRIIGLGKSMELVLTARKFGADEALALGLVSEVCAPEALLPRAIELAETIAAHPAPAVRMAKELLRQGAQASLEHTLTYEITMFKQAMATAEHGQAVKAMMEQIGRKK